VRRNWSFGSGLVIVILSGLLAGCGGAAPTAGSGNNAQAGNCTDVANPQTVTLASELKYMVTRSCTSGDVAKEGSSITINYVGRVKDTNKQFDSSFDHGGPQTFVLDVNHLIKGWVDGVQGMKVGEKRTLIIPPTLGYGAQGSPPAIPPNATLIFDIELLGVK
jgi:FKBP-type peptidyl-prolyl cis-trans isomerase